MAKYLYKLSIDYGISDDIEGLFIAEEKDVNDLIGQYVYFGEVLGKHSEVAGTIEENEITKLNIDADTVEILLAELGETISGFNPFDYVKHHCLVCKASYTTDWAAYFVYDESKTKGMVCEFCLNKEIENHTEGDV